MRIDFGDGSNNGKSGDKTPLKSGRYNFVVTKCELTSSPVKNTPQLALWTEVTSPGDANGKKRIMNFYLTKSSVWKLQSLMQAVNPSMATGEVEVEDIVHYLESDKPEFSAFVELDSEYNNNDFSNFMPVSEEDSVVTPASSNNKYDDLPM